MEKSKVPDIEKEIANLREFLSKRVRGQLKGVETVCNLIEDDMMLRDLEEKRGPVGIVMFLGPSGVGKTELARVSAQYLMGSENYLTKIQCVTLTQSHTIQTLLGAPHSYVGWDTPPLLSPDRIFRKNKPRDTSRLGSQEMVLQKQKMILTSKIKQLKKEQYEMEGEWVAILNHLRLIEESMAAIDDLRILLARIEDPSEEKKNKLNRLNPGSNEDIIKILEIANQELRVLISENEERNAKLSIFMRELRIVNEQIKKEVPMTAAEETSPIGNIAVILFDEIERADIAIHNLLLQIGEEGRVTLANGVESDLRKSLIILTSNVGARAIGDILKKKSIGFSGPTSKKDDHTYYNDAELEELEKRILDVAKGELERKFTPEFIGRLDAIVVFRPLSRATFMQILNDQIELFDKALSKKRNIKLIVEEDVKEKVLQSSLHRPESGARLLNHKLKSIVKRPFGRKLVKYPSFTGTVRAHLSQDDVDFEFISKA